MVIRKRISASLVPWRDGGQCGLIIDVSHTCAGVVRRSLGVGQHTCRPRVLAADVPAPVPHLPHDAAAQHSLLGRDVAQHRRAESHQLRHQVRRRHGNAHLPRCRRITPSSSSRRWWRWFPAPCCWCSCCLSASSPAGRCEPARGISTGPPVLTRFWAGQIFVRIFTFNDIKLIIIPIHKCWSTAKPKYYTHSEPKYCATFISEISLVSGHRCSPFQSQITSLHAV